MKYDEVHFTYLNQFCRMKFKKYVGNDIKLNQKNMIDFKYGGETSWVAIFKNDMGIVECGYDFNRIVA